MKLIFSILVFSLGILFLVTGVGFLFSVYKFKRASIKTLGTVVEIKQSTGRNKNKTYSPVLSYQAYNGSTYRYDVAAYYGSTYTIGQQIEILYLKDDPSKAKVNSFKHTFMPPAALTILGLIVMAIGLWLFYRK